MQLNGGSGVAVRRQVQLAVHVLSLLDLVTHLNIATLTIR